MNLTLSSHYRERLLISVLTLAVILLLPFGIIQTTRAATDTNNLQINDALITQAVERELLMAPEIPAHLIDVKTIEGVVTLSGSVGHLLARDRATKVAEMVKGVRTVINNIEVRPVTRTDEQIKIDVDAALAADATTEPWEITTDVSDGVVTLNGTVDSWPERELAAEVAKSVRGVKGVDNGIVVDLQTHRPASDIRAEVVRQIASDVWVDDALIKTKVDSNVVTLSGLVGSSWERERAIADAWVAGVQNVTAKNLTVSWADRDSMRREDWWSQAPDSEIKKAILDGLMFDPRVSMFTVDVNVADGKVTLSGRVDNLAARSAAQDIARNTIGVSIVHNMIKVRPRKLLTNQSLAQKVQSAIERDPYLSGEQVDVRVLNSEVTLTGKVETKFEKNHATDVIERIAGVAAVKNRLTFPAYVTEKSDWALKNDIETMFYWTPELDAGDIDVAVNNGKVTLSGTVDTWRQSFTAVNKAYEAGAEEVQDDLTVSYGHIPFYSWY